MSRTDRLLFAAGACGVGGHFLLLTHGAVRGYFSPDDMMNLYRAWSPPLGLLLKGIVLFFLHSPYYRPLAEGWYRLVFWFAGFNPAPFRLIALGFLLANLFLSYAVARRLSNSRLAAAMAALLLSYHGAFVSLYQDTGFIYDILCYFFYLWAFAWYVRVRQQGRYLRWSELAAIGALYVGALDSKEMAASLPLFLLGYELLFEKRGKPWVVTRRWAPILATGLMTVLFIGGRVYSHESLLLEHAAYQPLFTAGRFLETGTRFANELFYLERWFTPARLIALWAAMLAYALAARSRTLQFAWLFLLIAPLPVALLQPRDAPQYYIPVFGWALFASSAARHAVEALLRKLPPAARPGTLRAAGAALLAGFAILLYPTHKAAWASGAPAVSVEGEILRSVTGQLHRQYPRLPAHARLLFLNDPLPAWNMLFMARLSYGEDTLGIGTVAANEASPPAERLGTYDHVFDFRAGHLLELAPPWRRGPAPAVVIEAGRAQVFHDGFVPVTGDRPAIPSEVVFAQAFDLGATNPAVAGAFPRNPLVVVAAPVEVRVNGVPAEVLDAFGWPGEVNRYRLDIRIPRQTASGRAAVTVSTGGAAGPAVEIPVRSYAEVARREPPGPAIVVTGDTPEIFHADWQPVTSGHPAHPGELLITKASGLGETRPPVPQGVPFPDDPLVGVVARVEARVNGRPAEVVTAIGWPRGVGRYRVDIRIPPETHAGSSTVILSVNGIRGPAVPVPVR